jgi:hypothetical protein
MKIREIMNIRRSRILSYDNLTTSYMYDDIVEGFASNCIAILIKKVLGCFRLICWPT